MNTNFPIEALDTEEYPRLPTWTEYAETIHNDNVAKGFWPDNVMDRNVGEALCLIHSEITEAYEGVLDPSMMDDKLTDYPAVWVEIADAIIRVLDLGGAHGVDFDSPIVDVAELETPYGSGVDDLMDLHAAVDRVLEDHRKGLKSGEDGTPMYKLSLAHLFGKLLAFMEKYGIPTSVIDAKLDYNRSRPYKHGKKY